MLSGDLLGLAIVGEDPLARAGLEARLRADPGLSVVASLGPDELGQGTLGGSGARAVLWDLGPGGPGPAAAGALPRGLNELGASDLAVVVLLGAAGGDEAASRAVRTALQAGARALLPRDASAGQLAGAVRGAAAGLVVLDESLLTLLLGPAGPSVGAAASSVEPATPLSPRELEVLALLADGLSNKRLADRLGISEHTAKFHVNAILEKLGADTRTDAVVRAARLGLLIL